jgi:hypothetical protein
MSATIPDSHQENSVAHNEELASRVRTALAGRKDVEEKKMFGGHCQVETVADRVGG